MNADIGAMDEGALCDLVAHALGRELAVLQEISALQQQVKEAARGKKWADYEAIMAAMAAAGGELEALEAKRQALMAGRDTAADAARADAERFYVFVLRFSPDCRRNLTGLYQNLKLEAAKIRFTNTALHEYVHAQVQLVSGVLEAAFPDRRGMLYGRMGRPRSVDMRSVVINRSF
jgi:hypothetical protein